MAVALKQLRRNLDPVAHLGANGRAKVDGADDGEATVEESIEQARLAQLVLANAAARLEAGIRSGRYLLVDDARRVMGRQLA